MEPATVIAASKDPRQSATWRERAGEAGWRRTRRPEAQSRSRTPSNSSSNAREVVDGRPVAEDGLCAGARVPVGDYRERPVSEKWSREQGTAVGSSHGAQDYRVGRHVSNRDRRKIVSGTGSTGAEGEKYGRSGATQDHCISHERDVLCAQKHLERLRLNSPSVVEKRYGISEKCVAPSSSSSSSTHQQANPSSSLSDRKVYHRHGAAAISVEVRAARTCSLGGANQESSNQESSSQESSNQESNISGQIRGLCADMCPKREREERACRGYLDPYEWLAGDRYKTDETLAVKEFRRMPETAPECIRPLPVLQKTMRHLLRLLERGYGDDVALSALHSFLWDRMRAIRTDITMQELADKETAQLIEQMIRFYILAMHELCEVEASSFDAHLNVEQMNKAMMSLFEMYRTLRKEGDASDREPEFWGYFILLKMRAGDLAASLSNMPKYLKAAEEVKFARAVSKALRSENYVAFFRLARAATYLQACIMHPHFYKVRSRAFAIIRSALMKMQGVPLKTVEFWLAMEGEDFQQAWESHGLRLRSFEMPYLIYENTPLSQTRHQFFYDEDGKGMKQHIVHRSPLVLAKRSQTVAEDVKGALGKL